MKFSVFSPVLTGGMFAEPDDAIRYAADLGILAVQIFGHEFEKKSLKEYRKLYDSYGVKVSSIIQCAYLSDPDSVNRANETDNVKRITMTFFRTYSLP